MILTNRKRAVVALAHSVAFLALAAATGKPGVRQLAWGAPLSAWIMPSIYAAVTSVLSALAAAGRGSERLYFTFCATSAAFGLARQVAGDPPLHFAVYVRVTMLACATATGILIVRAKPS
jgi:hypothetical protein